MIRGETMTEKVKYSITGIAKELNSSYKTIRKYVDEAIIDCNGCVFKIGKAYSIDREKFKEFINNKTREEVILCQSKNLKTSFKETKFGGSITPIKRLSIEEVLKQRRMERQSREKNII
jgi:hypothetical protein